MRLTHNTETELAPIIRSSSQIVGVSHVNINVFCRLLLSQHNYPKVTSDLFPRLSKSMMSNPFYINQLVLMNCCDDVGVFHLPKIRNILSIRISALVSTGQGITFVTVVLFQTKPTAPHANFRFL